MNFQETKITHSNGVLRDKRRAKTKAIRGQVNKTAEVTKDHFSSFGWFIVWVGFFSPHMPSTALQSSGEN